MSFTTKNTRKIESPSATEALLGQKGLVVNGPLICEVSKAVDQIKNGNNTIKLLFGETYDEKGNSIDSLKYYLFIDSLARALKQDYDIDTKPTVLIADLSVSRNVPERAEEMQRLARDRLKFAKKVKEVYRCEYNAVLMSEFVKTKNFSETCENLRKRISGDPKLLALIEKTVPEDKLEVERKSGYMYSIEELATIFGVDFKVGPPRETHYDLLSNEISPNFGYNTLLGVYLYPTYPLGLHYEEYLGHGNQKPLLDKHDGLTPYKVDSKGLSNRRIALGITTFEEVARNVEATEISKSLDMPNPIMDLIMITGLAKQHLEPNVDYNSNVFYEAYYVGDMQETELKQEALTQLKRYVIDKF